MTRRVRAVLFTALALAATPAVAAAQYKGVRFEIAAVGDTTITFRSGDERWLRNGARGIAVDPRRRDALVARLRVSDVGRETATAVVTGQTTVITTEHIVVLTEPRLPWYRRATFWLGALVGASLGVAAGSQL